MSISAVRSDIVELSSGAEIDLFDFNVKACKSADDVQELMIIIEEKIIDIEYQIDCFHANSWSNGAAFTPGNRPDATWFPRAKKALALTRLQKSEANVFLQRYGKMEADKRQRELDRRFVDLARVMLPREQFSEIMRKADSIGKISQ